MPGPGTRVFRTMTPFAARASAAVLTASSLSVSWAVAALVSERSERTNYYAITGRSADELRQSMNENRPVDKDGNPHDAVTSWHVRWRYTTDGSFGGCAVRSFDVSLDIAMTFPRWTNESQGAPALVQYWRAYLSALGTHEEGHKAIGRGAAADIRDAGARVPPQSKCSELAAAIDKTTAEILGRYRQRERDYDRETRHGRTQGVRFP